MWFYNDKQFTSTNDFPLNTYGFIYIIENLINGKFYIGKKVLFSKQNKKLGKKELAALPVSRGRKPSTKEVITESNWLDYYGSSKDLQNDIKKLGKENFKRKIVHFCYSKKHLTYMEVKTQFAYDVLESTNCYNDSIGGRYYKKDIVFSL